MELYEYIKIFKRYRYKIAAVAMVFVFAGLGMSFVRFTQYEGSFSLIIRPKALEKTENFRLADALEASDRMSRMTENWIKEQKWGIITKHLGDQIIKISFQDASESNGRKRMESIKEKSNGFIASLSPTSGLGAFEALSSDFSFKKRDPYLLAFLVGGFLAGFVAGLFLSLFKHYLDNETYYH